jgi:hypothetical protein
MHPFPCIGIRPDQYFGYARLDPALGLRRIEAAVLTGAMTLKPAYLLAYTVSRGS